SPAASTASRPHASSPGSTCHTCTTRHRPPRHTIRPHGPAYSRRILTSEGTHAGSTEDTTGLQTKKKRGSAEPAAPPHPPSPQQPQPHLRRRPRRQHRTHHRTPTKEDAGKLRTGASPSFSQPTPARQAPTRRLWTTPEPVTATRPAPTPESHPTPPNGSHTRGHSPGPCET